MRFLYNTVISTYISVLTSDMEVSTILFQRLVYGLAELTCMMANSPYINTGK